MTQLLDAIEDCLAEHRLLPCLTLLYFGIDVVASLERRPGEKPKAAFVRWVDENLLEVRPLPCTALELYAARCGVVHTFTAESDLSRKGLARQVIYAWGDAKTDNLAAAANLVGRTDVAVHIRELIDGFRVGLANYLEEVERSPERQGRVEAGAGLWFTRIDQDVVKKLLDMDNREPSSRSSSAHDDMQGK
jgi:hypothetical protein